MGDLLINWLFLDNWNQNRSLAEVDTAVTTYTANICRMDKISLFFILTVWNVYNGI